MSLLTPNLQTQLILGRLKMKSHAMIATALDLHPHFVEAAIHLVTDITVVDRLRPVVTALVATITVVVHLLHATMITVVMVVIVHRHLLAQLVHLLTTLTHPLVVVMAAMIRMERLLLVVPMTTLMLPMDMIDLERGLHHLGHMEDMKSVHRQDTGDCSSPLCRTPIPKGHLLIIIEIHPSFPASCGLDMRKIRLLVNVEGKDSPSNMIFPVNGWAGYEQPVKV